MSYSGPGSSYHLRQSVPRHDAVNSAEFAQWCDRFPALSLFYYGRVADTGTKVFSRKYMIERAFRMCNARSTFAPLPLPKKTSSALKKQPHSCVNSTVFFTVFGCILFPFGCAQNCRRYVFFLPLILFSWHVLYKYMYLGSDLGAR